MRCVRCRRGGVVKLDVDDWIRLMSGEYARIVPIVDEVREIFEKVASEQAEEAEKANGD